MKVNKSKRLDYFKQFLSWYWLRPESAILTSLRAEAYTSTLDSFGNGEATLDISCGDGVFSFITLGGKLSKNSDMYRSILTENIFRDENYDAYDHFNQNYIIEIEKAPDSYYEYGTDWKANLLKKAKKLNLYTNLINHDNNHVLPLENNSMQYVYSNSSYWVKNFVSHLNDIVRVTKPGGTIVFEMKTNDIEKYNSAKYIPFMGEKFHKIIDAGRLSTWKGLPTKSEIISIFDNIENVTIERFQPIYGNIIGQIWDIGIRPLFNPLAKMANELSPLKRLNIKDEWCTIIFELFSEFLSNYDVDENTSFEYLIVLKKQNI